MTKHRIQLLAAMLFLATGIFGQSYQQLWNKVNENEQKDLPRTALEHLKTIEDKALGEKAYGQLLKASLMKSKLWNEIDPDSLKPAVQRLEQQEKNAPDQALQAVYSAVLSQIYKANPSLAEDWSNRQQYYYKRALAHPEVLAKIHEGSYAPFVVEGKDSYYFGNNLLSVVGIELGAWQWLHDYYKNTDNRKAACLTAAKAIDQGVGYNWRQRMNAIDSLINVYGDLPEAGELAIVRYQNMSSQPDEQYAWLKEAIRRWDKWPRINELRNTLARMTNPSFWVLINKYVVVPGQRQTVRLQSLRNISSLTMRVYQTTLTGTTSLNPDDKDDYQKIQKGGLTEKKEWQRTLTFSGHEEYEQFNDSTELAGLPAGVYMLEFSTNPETGVKRMLYFVSSLRIIIQAQPNETKRFVVVDATSGQPVGGAGLSLFYKTGWHHPTREVKYICDSNGEVVVDEIERSATAFAYTKKDTSSPDIDCYGRYSYYEHDYKNESISLFTDRSIYRPGQTVHVAAIVWREKSVTDNVAVSNRPLTFVLRDANSKLVSEQKAVTDEYGKCSATFTLPQGLLNGRFTIRADRGSTSFRVEDYKRPTFRVEFDEYKESYQAGDTVRAQGKAMTYAGVPVQGGRVHYKVRRQVAYWWISYSRYWQHGAIGGDVDYEDLYEGDATTADDGTFKVNMPMILPRLGYSTMFYHIVVEADVTDIAGETHQGSLSLPLGNKATTLVCDLPKQIRNDELKTVTFSRRNMAGQPIEGKVKYRVDGGRWQTCAANESLSVAAWKLKSGGHHVEAFCGEDSLEASFVIFSLADTRPATTTHDWFYVSDYQFPSDGSPVTVQVGSSDPDLHVVYSIFSGKEILESGSVKLNGTLLNRKFKYQEKYHNGLLLTYAWVKDGRCYMHEQAIMRPMPDKRMKMKWATFRDRLIPGQQEEWTVTVTQPDKRPAAASLMAVLYDKSLDQLQPHQWSFAPSHYVPLPTTSWMWHEWGDMTGGGNLRYKALEVKSFSFSHFDHDVYPSYYSRMQYYGTRRLSKVANRSEKVLAEAPMAMMEEKAIGSFDVKEAVAVQDVVGTDEAAETGASGEDNGGQQEVQVRENLQETAFFYPSLTTDSAGTVAIRFTLPESLTTWRFMGVSNTTDMLFGSMTGEAVASKEVMLLPNVPRFIRQGDEAQITGRVINTGDHAISGTATLQLLNAEDEQLVLQQEMPFDVAAGKTTSVTFGIPATMLHESLLICRMVARGDGFSDGEQHYLPVLPDHELVTKTVPVTQHEPGVKAIDLTKLFPAVASQQKLTVEYTNQPAWLMVQALPTLGQPSEWSAVSLAASYYSNTLAKSMLTGSPQVKKVFEQWKREATQESLQSQLMKNQELKDIVLNETPWVADADRESDQKQRLADFFDSNAINHRLSTAIDKLQKLQNSDGSFAWFPEMPGSTMMTVAVQEMLVRLNMMVGYQVNTSKMRIKASEFLGKEMKKVVNELKKQEKKGYKPTFPSFTALRWLYICAIADDELELPNDVRSANDYLVNLLKKEIKRQTIYEKALSAVVFYKRGETKLANQYVKSLKEYTVFTEEMGRYYNTKRASYSWYDYKIPTEVAAIEAIGMVTPNEKKTIDEMRRWLLQEKRTQSWDTPINSVNAIYAFFGEKGISQLSATDQSQTEIAIDGKALELPKATAGIGYVKTAVSEPKGQTLTMTKTSQGTSWGAVYAQFLQKTSEVEASQGGITVKRELIKGEQKGPSVSLKVGDRVKMRITIETTRDLDFVQVCDRRAACMEPLKQLSGYHAGAYVSPKDYATHYYYYGLAKGKHVIETEYYIDRAGSYETGTCTVQCAYSPEFRATAPSALLIVNSEK